MERCVFKLICENRELKTEILHLYEEMLVCFVPSRIKLKHYKNNYFVSYSKKIKKELLIEELSAKDGEIYFKDINNSFRFINGIANNMFLLSITIMNDLINDAFIKKIEDVFEKCGIIAYAHNLHDNVEQNDIIISNEEKQRGQELGVEYNPGHSHIVNGIWFGSCYRMWFGKEFYQYISKEKLQSFSNCYENIELENEVTRITLYENLWDFAKPENREIQWDFRRSVGMDEVAHALEEEFSKKKVTDPEVEIKTGSFPHGGIRLIHQYFDGNGNITHKSKAKIVKSAEYSADGKILFSEENSL